MLVLPHTTARCGGYCPSEKTSRLIHSIYLLVVLSLVAASHCRTEEATDDQAFRCNLPLQSSVKQKLLYIDDTERALTLLTSRRIPHVLLTHVVAILLREYLGYGNVLITYSDGLYPYDTLKTFGIDDRQLPDTYMPLKVPNAFINLEIWFPPFDNDYSRALTEVSSVSYLGLVGRMGWFFPEYVVTKNNVTDIWRIFIKQSSPALRVFSRTEEELLDLRPLMLDPATNKYYCDNELCANGTYTPPLCRHARCAVLFASYYNVSDFLIEQILDKSLRVKVVWLGPNLNMSFVAENEYFPMDRSILFIHYSPSTVTQPFNLTSVAFPYCSDDKMFCPYEMHRLKKMIWKKLKDIDPFLYKSVDKITINKTTYSELISEYNLNPDISEQQIACNWMIKNKKTWERWSAGNSKPVLELVGMFPMNVPTIGHTNMKFLAPGCATAFEMAIEAINLNSSILPNFHIEPFVVNTGCDADMVMYEFIRLTKNRTYNKLIGIVGPACSDTVEPIVGVSKFFKMPIISYGAEGAIFSDRTKYPYFFRTIPENIIFRDVYFNLFKRLKWNRIASLNENGHQYSEYLTPLQDLLQINDMTFNMRKYPQEVTDMTAYLQDLKQKKFKIIIGDFYEDIARIVMCEAINLGMTGNEGYVWFFPGWFLDGWWDIDEIKLENPSYSLNCSTVEMLRGLQSHMSLSYKYFADDNSIMPENISVKEWRQRYERVLESINVSDSDYAGFTYDAVWMYALALDKLFKEDQLYTANLRSTNTIERFIHYINKTNFNGVSGPINFTAGPSRQTEILINQFTYRGYREVGRFSPANVLVDKLNLDMNKLQWPSKIIPHDGTVPIDECIVETFRLFFGEGTNCISAIIILCTICFGTLAVLLIILVVFVKHRYELKLRQLEDMMNRQSIYKDFKEWEIARNKVVINRKLGEGEFGTVYGGECHIEPHGWQAAAIKTLKVGSSMTVKVDFLTEAEVMKNVKHDNIVRLIGVCTDSEPIYTVMEFMLYGDLKTFLLARRNLVNEKNRYDDDEEVSDKRLTSMALDVAKAMTYLADMKYVHRDIACRNCLVNAYRSVKLADFGLTRPIVEKNYYRFSRKGMLPVRWMAPESLLDGVFTPMTDIWSYGVLLYEIITFGAFPFLGLNNNQVFDRVKAGYTLPTPAGIKPDLESLMHACWHANPAQRISASLVVVHLESCPRLITPCLDAPQSSVPIENPVGLELRKLSLALNNSRCANNQTVNMTGAGGVALMTNRKRSMSGNMVVPPPHGSSNLGEDDLSANLDALNLIEEKGDDPILAPSQYISSSRFKSLSNKDLERERELLVKKQVMPSIWTNVTPV